LHNILGAIFAKRGDMDQAIEHFSDAVRLNPDYEDARRNLEEAKTMRDRIGLSDP
jgi:tetratricopeptide (TPR) repeat protein